jgi:hypothetical protein
MRKQHAPKRFKSLWGDDRIGKYSIEEIALECILWEDAARRDDADRRNFIQKALDQNFSGKHRADTLRRFCETYERLYEKIYHRTPDHSVTHSTSGGIHTFEKRAA